MRQSVPDTNCLSKAVPPLMGRIEISPLSRSLLEQGKGKPNILSQSKLCWSLNDFSLIVEFARHFNC